MSPRRRSLSCPREKLEPFFPKRTIMFLKKRSFFSFENMVAPSSNLSLVFSGAWLFLGDQLKPFFLSGTGMFLGAT
jgi:hypothetical protein